MEVAGINLSSRAVFKRNYEHSRTTATMTTRRISVGVLECLWPYEGFPGFRERSGVVMPPDDKDAALLTSRIGGQVVPPIRGLHSRTPSLGVVHCQTTGAAKTARKLAMATTRN
jgi:hypothetical protein